MPRESSEQRLIRLLDKSVPQLKLIHEEFLAISPADAAGILKKSPELIFFFDYYFRLFEPDVGARIISDPQFPVESTADLFNCQLVRVYRANMQSESIDLKDASLLESYWVKVSRAKLLLLFKFLHECGKANQPYTILILRKLKHNEILHLLEGKEIKSAAVLELFKQLGEGVKEMIAGDFDLFDIIFRLASDLGDTDYLHFLEEYTMLTVQLRIAQSSVEEAQKYLDVDGELPFNELIRILREMPRDCLDITLNYFIKKKFISSKMRADIREILRGEELLTFEE